MMTMMMMMMMMMMVVVVVVVVVIVMKIRMIKSRGNDDAYRMDKLDSQWHLYQDDGPRRRKFLGYIACSQSAPFGPDKSLLWV